MPQIVMWSIGNEIPMRDTPKGRSLYHELADEVRSIDPTRFVTSAIPMVKDADEPDFAALDVSGYNYSPNRYDADHAKYPDRVMVGTESFPTSSFEMWDHIWNSSWVVGDFM
jgi:beta-galactosidase